MSEKPCKGVIFHEGNVIGKEEAWDLPEENDTFVPKMDSQGRNEKCLVCAKI